MGVFFHLLEEMAYAFTLEILQCPQSEWPDSLKGVLQHLPQQAEWTETSESPHHGTVLRKNEEDYQEENRQIKNKITMGSE